MELLSPAGTLKAMRRAFAYGADAVYAGQPRYSLRVRENEFNKLDVMASAISEAHQLGKLFFVASNISPHNSKVRSYLKNMAPVIEMGPDALIMSDPGLIMMVRERWPGVPIHLSVQANALNFATVKFWKNFGLKRIILSRELSLKEIREIREECPDIELEVFVHGALCIAYSGRCLLSGYMNHRDSNQGNCTNSCRWLYQVNEATATPEGDYQLANACCSSSGVSSANDNRGNERQQCNSVEDKVFLLEEPNRPGQYMPAFEDEHGTYIMNSKDLRAVEYIGELAEIGIDSVKIEGRTKSAFYAARTAQVYRRAIDDVEAGRPFDPGLMDELESLSNRGFTEGFYKRQPVKDMQNYDTGYSSSTRHKFVGEVTGCQVVGSDKSDSQGDIELTVDVKNRFDVGDRLELMTPVGNVVFNLIELLDTCGNNIESAPGSGHSRRIRLANNQIDWQKENLSVEALKLAMLLKYVAVPSEIASDVSQ